MGNKNLEDMMASCREKEFQAQLDAQEQKSEGQLLRDKLALNESKLFVFILFINYLIIFEGQTGV